MQKHVIQKDIYVTQTPILVAVDCIIFGFDGNRLKSLLIKRTIEPMQGKWSLLGGFAKEDESLDEASSRVLSQLSGIKNLYMEQMYCFSAPKREPNTRVISVAYFALIKIEDYNQNLGQEFGTAWYDIDQLPNLVFDHETMVMMALKKIQDKASTHPIGFALLPEKFTMLQLQGLYEAIYNKKFDKRNFNRRIQKLDIIIKLDEKEKSGSKKGSYLYVFDKEKYENLSDKGLSFI